MKKLRLLTTLLAAAALGACASYDYVGGNAPGGYYYGRASSGAGYGPYYDGYGYPSYGYGGYGGYRGYGYGYGGYYNPYYGYGGYPYYPHRPHRPRPPQSDPPRDGRAPPWRDPVDGRYRESGRVMLPPANRVLQAPAQPQVVGGGRPAMSNPGLRMRPPNNDATPRVSTPSPVQVERALLAARTQAEHASAVIARVREFVRAREPKRDAQDLAAIADTVLELLRLEAERQQLRIDLALARDLPAVHADRVMVEQVLLNLVKNAIEAMREVPAAQRELRIEGRVNLDDEVEVRVLDRGGGLSAAQSEQLFSPFFTTKSDGLGIGLAICRSIIEYHEGRLFFEPRPGGGSMFCFTLPRAQGRAQVS